MVKRCVQTGTRTPGAWAHSPPAAAGWMQKLGPDHPPQRPTPHSCRLLTLLTIQVVAPPGSVPGGQAALWEAHLFGPAHIPGLQQGLLHQRVLQGAHKWGQLSVGASGDMQFRGAEESLEGHLWGRHTARGGIILAGDGGVWAQQVFQGGPLQLGGCIRATGEPSKVWNWGREGGRSCEAEAPGAPVSYRDPAPSSDACPHFPSGGGDGSQDTSSSRSRGTARVWPPTQCVYTLGQWLICAS